MAYTTTEVLQISDICQFLAADSEAQGNLFRGGYERIGLSRLIYIVKSSVNWLNSYNPSDSTLLGKANYLFSLCQPFVGQALQILGSGGSGTIVNPATGVISTIVARYIDFTIGASGSLMNAGDVTLVLNYTSVLSSSVSIALDGTDLPAGTFTDRIAFNAVYTSNNVTITFNQGAINSQVYSIRLLQYISV